MTSLFDNSLLRKAIIHPTQFLGFEFILTEKFLLFSNENFQSIEKYHNFKHTRATIEVYFSSRYKISLFQVSIEHFFTIMLKDAWNIRLISELSLFVLITAICSIKHRTIYCVLTISYTEVCFQKSLSIFLLMMDF